MTDYDLIREIDETIDHLIENACALASIAAEKTGYELEKSLLEHTQESLLAHLFDLDKQYCKQQKSAAVDVKRVKNISFDAIEQLPSLVKLKSPKVKLSKLRLTRQ
jgi:hypothetical protein